MYQYQDQKEMRRALNGKMIVMLVGIMLVMTALTSSLSYGMRCWSMAGMADKGNEEVLEALKQIDRNKRREKGNTGARIRIKIPCHPANDRLCGEFYSLHETLTTAAIVLEI